MIPVDVPVDFISVGVSLAVGVGEVVGGVLGVCVMKNVVYAGVGFLRHVVSGTGDVEDVKIDRTVRVRHLSEYSNWDDYQVDGRKYRNVDWRDGRLLDGESDPNDHVARSELRDEDDWRMR